ncbi:ATP-dependent Clp protease proteolytic subunit [Planctomycetes bacterium Pan216]|uniref:ATP-dependent Clp protease proteolytic subunit n=1 Tax=Kolteria novifilia TaxID=2527975 RepID=A0A518BAR1_9BACT|nr:ATP-dependent Clp protease proteolytic subunit [Planctomycetes bacterium Pan216]
MAKRKTSKPASPPPEIAIIGDLSEDGEKEIVDAILDIEPGSEATMYIDSGGGSVYSALAIVTLMRIRKLKATAIVIGECSSSTLLVFAACQRRLVTERSVFLFHRVKWRSDKDYGSAEAVNWASHFQWLESEADRYQAELFGAEEEPFSSWVNEGRFVLGPELAEMGLAELIDA